MPRLKSPPAPISPTYKDDEEDADLLYDESFESFDSPKHSDQKNNNFIIEDDTNNIEGKDIKDMDLEQFMSRHDVDDNDNNNNNNNNNITKSISMTQDPSMRPLDGLSPISGDRVSIMMSKRLGYNVQSIKAIKKTSKSDKSGGSCDKGDDDDDDDEIDDGEAEFEDDEKISPQDLLVKSNALKQQMQRDHQFLKDKVKESQQEKESTGKEESYVSPAMLRKNIQGPSALKIHEIEQENAAKVDALLSSLNLMPISSNTQSTVLTNGNGKGPGNKGNSNSNSSNSNKHQQQHPNSNRKAAQVYGLGAMSMQDKSQDPSSTSMIRQQASSEHQIASLKKELKMRDDRLQRMTEHSMLLNSTCDDLRDEVGQLNAKVKSLEKEIEMKEARIATAIKAKKKAQKKYTQVINDQEGFDVVKAEYDRLKEREVALIEAVSELSTQNEDLISKLKLSMQRELELATMRTTLATSSALNSNTAAAAVAANGQFTNKMNKPSGRRSSDSDHQKDRGGRRGEEKEKARQSKLPELR